MKVLFCTDGSKISYYSIQNFSHWVKNFSVDILCAIDWSFLPDAVSVEDSEFGARCANSADSILDYSEAFLKEQGINVNRKIKMCGSTVDCILDACENADYDCIVLGSHGKKGIQKWLGSVSQEVAAVSSISTYISKSLNNREKILFAVDSSEISESVIKKCLESLDFSGKEIELVTVYEIPDYLFLEGNIDPNWILEVDKRQETASGILLNRFESLFNESGISIKNKTILAGVPSDEIIKYSSKSKSDLIVCGIHNRKYLSRFLLSSVSKRVLEGAKSDVLIIR